MRMFKKFATENKAATAIEYGLIAALIAVAGITAISSTGGGVKKTFESVSGSLPSA